MRGRTFAQVLESVRLESGRSASTTLGLNEEPALKQRINRLYEFFWFDYNWPFLKIMDADVAVLAGTYKFNPPASIDLERIDKVAVRFSSLWRPVNKGIMTEMYNALDSEADQRSEPIENYDLMQTGATTAEVLATGSFTVTGGTASAGVNKVSAVLVNGVDILGAAVDWVTSHTATAAALAAQINTFASSPNYIASSAGAIVNIVAITGSGATPNAFVVSPTVAGDVTVGSVVNMAGGVTAASSGVPQIVVWPRPIRDTTVRFQGWRAFSKLVNNADVMLLDDQLIYLHATAELLAKAESSEAPAVAAAARKRYNTLKFGYDKNRNSSFSLAGQRDPVPPHRGEPEIRIAIAPVSS